MEIIKPWDTEEDRARRRQWQEKWQESVKGQKFAMKETMPSAGRAEPSKLNSNRIWWK